MHSPVARKTSLKSCHDVRLETAFRQLKVRAFTLIEVVISLGIVAFAFTAIIGLLPVGLSSSRSAITNTVGANILSAVMNDFRQLDFSEVVATNRWYDDQGFEVPMEEAIYNVEVSIATGQLPATTPRPNENLKTVTLEIVNNPGGTRVNIPDSDKARFTTYLARTESIADGTTSPNP